MLTGNKDVDRKILNELEDKDLVNACQINKKAHTLCNDQVFWMNRVSEVWLCWRRQPKKI